MRGLELEASQAVAERDRSLHRQLQSEHALLSELALRDEARQGELSLEMGENSRVAGRLEERLAQAKTENKLRCKQSSGPCGRKST